MRPVIYNKTKKKLSCFKAYDIRGRVPDELNEDLAFRIGQASAALLSSKSIVIGYDIRLSSPVLASALTEGFLKAGVDVFDLGQCGTEEIYFAAFHLDVDGGIIVTASHNPADYNGMKLVRRGSIPISSDSGLDDIEKFAGTGKKLNSPTRGKKKNIDNRSAYIDHLLGYVNIQKLKPFKLVVNSGNGCAGAIIDLLEKHLPFSFVKLQHEPDGNFPNGVPNPLLPENRMVTAQAVRDSEAVMGIAWDGDFDRCFLFDENGDFIEGYYMVGLLAQAILHHNPGGKIIHDPRLIWNTLEVVRQAGGIPVMSKTGHAFIKEKMRREDAIYGGEMSGHHYFKDFAYCDSGMIPWLLVAKILSVSGKKLSNLVGDRIKAFPVSGEINNKVDDPDKIITKIESFYGKTSVEKDYTDGLSMTFHDFRFNVRKSNTEPVLRLNVESRKSRKLMKEKTKELLKLILYSKRS